MQTTISRFARRAGGPKLAALGTAATSVLQRASDEVSRLAAGFPQDGTRIDKGYTRGVARTLRGLVGSVLADPAIGAARLGAKGLAATDAAASAALVRLLTFDDLQGAIPGVLINPGEQTNAQARSQLQYTAQVIRRRAADIAAQFAAASD